MHEMTLSTKGKQGRACNDTSSWDTDSRRAQEPVQCLQDYNVYTMFGSCSKSLHTKASSTQAAELLSRLLAKLKTQRNTAGQRSPHWAHSSAFRTQGSHRCWWPNLYESVCLDLNATLPPALAHVIIAPSTYQRRTEHSKMGCNPAVAMFYGKHCMPSSHNTSTVHNAVRRTKLLLSST